VLTSNLVNKGATAAPFVYWDYLNLPAIHTEELLVVSARVSRAEVLTPIDDGELVWRPYCAIALDALDEYAKLEDGWDGDDAIAPSRTSLKIAESFLAILSTNVEECPEIRPMLDQDGVPGFFWDTGRRYLSISIYEPNELAYVFIDRDSGAQELREIDLFDPQAVAILFEHIESLG